MYDSFFTAPERARTPNLSVRSRTLYPIELLAHGLYRRKRHYSTILMDVN